MEDEHQDLTTRLNETTDGANTTVNIQEVNNIVDIFINYQITRIVNTLSHSSSFVFLLIINNN